MKRSIKKIIAAVVVLLILVGAYFAVNKLPSADENEKNSLKEGNQQITESTGQETNTNIFLIKEKAEDVSSVVFNNGEISYTIQNGVEPTIEGYSSHIINTSALNTAVYKCTYILSEGIVENADDLSKYGLDKEDKYIVLKLKNGEERKIFIGNPTYVNGEYYAKTATSGDVHIISQSMATHLLQNPSEYRSTDIAEIINNTVSEFSISKGSEKVLDIKYTHTKKESSQMHVYKVLYPYDNVEANLDAVNMFCQTLSSVYATEIVEEDPTDLSKYGLDNPYILTVKDANRTSVVKMGNYADDGTVYVMKGDVPVVYKADCSFYETVKNINPEDYVGRFVHLFNIKDVSGITVKNSEKTYNLVITKKSEDKYEYKINDRIKVKETFTPIYTEIIGISAATFEADGTQGEEKCSISFKFNDGSNKLFTYYSYNERYCVVKADNGLTCLVTTESLDHIFETLEK